MKRKLNLVEESEYGSCIDDVGHAWFLISLECEVLTQMNTTHLEVLTQVISIITGERG